MPTATVTVSPTPVPYILPYPGILPDHPLWFIKAARDRIIGILIADPLKKAEFNLLQADKRLSAGATLIKKRKEGLAVSTISKGENYFSEAITKLKEARGAGKDVNLLLDKMTLSTKKHQEMLSELVAIVPQNFRADLEKERQRTINHEKYVKEISK